MIALWELPVGLHNLASQWKCVWAESFMKGSRHSEGEGYSGEM